MTTRTCFGRGAAPALGAALLALACAAEEGPSPAAPVEATFAPLDGLTPEWAERWEQGHALIAVPFSEAMGLGPVYVEDHCGACHPADASRDRGEVVKAVAVLDDGVTPHPDHRLPWGSTHRPKLAGGGKTPAVYADDPGIRFSIRSAPTFHGRGYLEAVRDEEIERVEAAQALRTDGISGRINRVRYQAEPNPETPFHRLATGDEGLIGRFGLKAATATIDDFTSFALVVDQSISNPLRPEEFPNPDGLIDDARPGVDVDLATVNALADFARLSRIPARPDPPPGGPELFEEVLCAVCHVPALRTRADYPIEALRDIDAPIFSDLLLHDMGVGLDDSIGEGDALGAEWRTAPLIGLATMAGYLHDGRAATIEAAILAHGSDGSEAAGSVARFEALSDDERRLLLEYVGGL